MNSRTMDPAIVSTLLHVYRSGGFPMGEPATGEVFVVRPPERAVIDLQPTEAFRISRSLARTLRRGTFHFTTDRAFTRVVRACAAPRRPRPGHPPEDGSETWITPEMIDWYEQLHQAGHAHALEAWKNDHASGEAALVGGIYGVSIGAAFFAESMFHTTRQRLPDGRRHPLDGTDASKASLATLVAHLRNCGYALFDTQFQNDHIARFGVREIPIERFMQLLAEAVDRPDPWRPLP